MLKVVHVDDSSHRDAAVGGSLLDEIAREGARQMLAAAMAAETAAYVESLVGEVDEDGHRLVVRNGFHEPREVVTAAGAIPVRQPRVNDKRVDEVTGQRMRFSSKILPAWSRRSPKIAEVLPLLYLHGLSTGDFTPALEQFLGSGAGLSAATIGRLTTQWQDEASAFNKRSLAHVDYVYVWVDGIHFKVRLDQDRVCLLVIIGVRADGKKELVALADGFRESVESWSDLLRSCRRRGMVDPVLAVGDGALGFWKAVRDVFPATREQRCWFHKSANVLSSLPKSAHPGAKTALAQIYNAEDVDHARVAVKAFELDFGAKYPKAVAKITNDVDVLLEFFTYPAEHWIHLRTTDENVNAAATACLMPAGTSASLGGHPSLPDAVARSRGQGGAPAAKRGRTTLTAVRTAVACADGGRGRPRSEEQGVGLRALSRCSAVRRHCRVPVLVAAPTAGRAGPGCAGRVGRQLPTMVL